MQVATDLALPDAETVTETAAAKEGREVDLLAEFAKKTSYTAHHRQDSRQTVNAVRSPMCRVLFVILVVYVIMLVFTIVFNYFATSSCGLGPSYHYLRLKNETSQTSGGGIAVGSYPNGDGTTDIVSEITSGYVNNIDKLFIQSMPVGIVLNATSGKNRLTSLRFLSPPPADYLSGGAATTSFDVITPDRRLIQLARPFFNSQYYLRNTTRLEVSDSKSNVFVGTNEKNEYVSTRSHREEGSTVPYWFIGMEALSTPKQACAKDFGFEVRQQFDFHMFMPFIVRDFDSEIQFKDTAFKGELVCQNCGEMLRLRLENSTVKMATFTQKRVAISTTGSSTLAFRKEKTTTLQFYGVAAIELDGKLRGYRAAVKAEPVQEILVNGAVMCADVESEGLITCAGASCICVAS